MASSDVMSQAQLRRWITQTLTTFDKPVLPYEVCVGVARLHDIAWPPNSYMKIVADELDRMAAEGTVTASFRSVMRNGGPGLSSYHYELNILDKLASEPPEGPCE